MNDSERLVRDTLDALRKKHGSSLTPYAEAMLCATAAVIEGQSFPKTEELAAKLAIERPLTDPA